MAVDIAAIDEAAHGFQQAAVDASRWVAALEVAARAAGAYGAVLLPAVGRLPGVPFTPSMGESMEQYFREDWALHDIRERGIPDLYQRGILVDQDFTSEAERRRLPYYNDLLARHGLRWSAGVAFHVDDQLWCLSLNRLAHQGPFVPEEQSALLRMGKRLTAAATLAHRLDFARLDGIADALEVIGSPALLLDVTGKVIRANRRAEGYFGHGLVLSHGKLMAQHPVSNKALQRHLHDAALDRRGPPAVDLNPVAVQRRERRPVLLQAQKQTGLAHDFFTRAAAIVLITDPDDAAEIPHQVLRISFGMTKREAELATLLERGIDLKDGADMLSVSYETARTHLKHIFEKTNTRKQSELIALIGRLRASRRVQT